MTVNEEHKYKIPLQMVDSECTHDDPSYLGLTFTLQLNQTATTQS